jgi:hypothetical protein
MGRTCEFPCALGEGRRLEVFGGELYDQFLCLNFLTVPQREVSTPGTTFTASNKSSIMEDKKRYTKIDPTQYVQYTGPTRRYPRVNPFEKKIIAPPKTDSQAKTDSQEEKEAEKGQTDPEQQQKPADKD